MQALRQVGGTIGVAVLGTVLSSGYHGRLDSGDVPSSVEDAVRSSVGAGIEVAHRLDSTALAQTVRSAFVHGMDTVLLASAALTILGEAERDAALARLQLLASVPALKARQGAEGRKAFDFYIRLFAARSGRAVDDYQLRVTTAAFTAALLEAARCWADAGGAESLGRLQDDAVTLIEPLIAAL